MNIEQRIAAAEQKAQEALDEIAELRAIQEESVFPKLGDKFWTVEHNTVAGPYEYHHNMERLAKTNCFKYKKSATDLLKMQQLVRRLVMLAEGELVDKMGYIISVGTEGDFVITCYRKGCGPIGAIMFGSKEAAYKAIGVVQEEFKDYFK
jgi:hypothetical protein